MVDVKGVKQVFVLEAGVEGERRVGLDCVERAKDDAIGVCAKVAQNQNDREVHGEVDNDQKENKEGADGSTGVRDREAEPPKGQDQADERRNNDKGGKPGHNEKDGRPVVLICFDDQSLEAGQEPARLVEDPAVGRQVGDAVGCGLDPLLDRGKDGCHFLFHLLIDGGHTRVDLGIDLVQRVCQLWERHVTSSRVQCCCCRGCREWGRSDAVPGQERMERDGERDGRAWRGGRVKDEGGGSGERVGGVGRSDDGSIETSLCLADVCVCSVLLELCGFLVGLGCSLGGEPGPEF